MILNHERQRQLLLQMIEDISIPGKLLDEMIELRQAIRDAWIVPVSEEQNPKSSQGGTAA